jgi:hypothetical protein
MKNEKGEGVVRSEIERRKFLASVRGNFLHHGHSGSFFAPVGGSFLHQKIVGFRSHKSPPFSFFISQLNQPENENSNNLSLFKQMSQKRKIEESSDESSSEEVQEKKIKEEPTGAETKEIKSNWLIEAYKKVLKLAYRVPVESWHWTEEIPSVRTGLWWEDMMGESAWRVIDGCEDLESKPALGATEEETEANYRKWARQAEPVVRRLEDDYSPGAADKIKTALQCLPDLRKYMDDYPL